MKKRKIPNTAIEVSTICLGTMTFGTPVCEKDAIKLTHWAFDNGINFIDTANMYEGYARSAGSSGGVAEDILGKALFGRRDKVILATKLGNRVGPEPEDNGTSPAAIRKQLDISLNRLVTDYIDIYYLHRPDANTPMVDILDALNREIEAGKIRYYGVSNYSAKQFFELLRVADENSLPRPIIHQPAYSLLNRNTEKKLLPLCKREQIAAAPYQVLQGGLLTGKYHRGEALPSDSRKAEMKGWVWDLTDELFYQLEQIENDAKAEDRTILHHTILETLGKPAIVSLVMGVKRIDQLEALINFSA
jgi:aryl-alcohol dehydrogenase-like predicted oxidoreductase